MIPALNPVEVYTVFLSGLPKGGRIFYVQREKNMIKLS